MIGIKRMHNEIELVTRSVINRFPFSMFHTNLHACSVSFDVDPIFLINILICPE